MWQQKRVVEFIEEHLAENVPLLTLAELVDLSVYHFARAFKQSFGVPPHRYHMDRRMDRARSLLQRPALSVTQIGIQTGFRETSSFTRAFRKITGLTPTEYRGHREDEAHNAGANHIYAGKEAFCFALAPSSLSFWIDRFGSWIKMGKCLFPVPRLTTPASRHWIGNGQRMPYLWRVIRSSICHGRTARWLGLPGVQQ